jgi:hypothetical protein
MIWPEQQCPKVVWTWRNPGPWAVGSANRISNLKRWRTKYIRSSPGIGLVFNHREVFGVCQFLLIIFSLLRCTCWCVAMNCIIHASNAAFRPCQWCKQTDCFRWRNRRSSPTCRFRGWVGFPLFFCVLQLSAGFLNRSLNIVNGRFPSHVYVVWNIFSNVPVST